MLLYIWRERKSCGSRRGTCLLAMPVREGEMKRARAAAMQTLTAWLHHSNEVHPEHPKNTTCPQHPGSNEKILLLSWDGAGGLPPESCKATCSLTICPKLKLKLFPT